MTIAIIDSGVDKMHKRFGNNQIKGLTLFENENGTVSEDKQFDDPTGHGTSICSIISQHQPAADIFMVKLQSYNTIISEQLLATAIELVGKMSEIRLLNISMGIQTNNPTKRLQEVCENVIANGITIVAASHYMHDKLCYPAHFMSVMSVAAGIIQNKYHFSFNVNRLTKCLAKGGFQRVASPDNSFRFATGTSLACAHLTGILATSFEKANWSDNQSLINWLEQASDNTIISLSKHDEVRPNTEIERRATDFSGIGALLRPRSRIQHIALFPYEEKEMSSILDNLKNCIYTISVIIGYPRMVKNVAHNDGVFSKIIHVNKALSEEDFDRFDTLVIGYFLDKLSDHDSFFGYTLIKECIVRQKNFIVWDSFVHNIILKTVGQLGVDYTGEIFINSIDTTYKDKFISNIPFRETRVPSICVIGTHNKQGKFTTQLTIKNVLTENGYAVSHLATEPQGIILGADITFPVGHKGTVSVDVGDWPKLITALRLYQEDELKPDLIITGSQGGILPLFPISSSTLPNKLLFVNSFCPDALVCTISPYDSLDFIFRSVGTITSYIKTKVLFYALTPITFRVQTTGINKIGYSKISNDEYIERLQFYNQNLDAPTVNIKDSANSSFILSSIQNYFSS